MTPSPNGHWPCLTSENAATKFGTTTATHNRIPGEPPKPRRHRLSGGESAPLPKIAKYRLKQGLDLRRPFRNDNCSGCHKRLRKAAELLRRVTRLLATDTSAWSDDVWIVDSMPVECGRSRETVHTITDLPARAASPQFIGQLARSQWGIEAVHHVKDTTFGEDASKIRTGNGPENMATPRSFAISALRTAGHRTIAASLREVSYAPFTRLLDLIGLL